MHYLHQTVIHSLLATLILTLGYLWVLTFAQNTPIWVQVMNSYTATANLPLTTTSIQAITINVSASETTSYTIQGDIVFYIASSGLWTYSDTKNIMLTSSPGTKNITVIFLKDWREEIRIPLSIELTTNNNQTGNNTWWNWWGNWWGWGTIIASRKDYCPSWDYSSSYYDQSCLPDDSFIFWWEDKTWDDINNQHSISYTRYNNGEILSDWEWKEKKVSMNPIQINNIQDNSQDKKMSQETNNNRRNEVLSQNNNNFTNLAVEEEVKHTNTDSFMRIVNDLDNERNKELQKRFIYTINNHHTIDKIINETESNTF